MQSADAASARYSLKLIYCYFPPLVSLSVALSPSRMMLFLL